MRFDLAIGNPPYQESHNTGSPIWQNFIVRNLEILEDGGGLAQIHPPRWRGTGTTNPRLVGELGGILKSMDMEWLAVHDLDEGRRVFGAGTMFDAYVLRKESTPGFETEIECGGETRRERIGGMEFVPNFPCPDLDLILAKEGEERVDVLLDRSMYQAMPANGWMARERSDEFPHPCVYSINADGEPVLRWSSEDRGHFGIPKAIFQVWNAQAPAIVDSAGDYGMTQSIAGIVDSPENLQGIAAAMGGHRFRECMRAVQFDSNKWNIHVIRLLRKDFWRRLS